MRLLRALQRGCDQSFEFRLTRFAETNHMPYQLALAIDHERLRNVPIVPQQLIYQFVIRDCEQVFDPEILLVLGDLAVVIFAADVQAHDPQALRSILFMKRDEVWRLSPARLAPGCVKIE